MEALLSVSNVRAGYRGEEIIRNATLEIVRGDFAGIIGPNGSGKTTLLRLCSRVLKPRAGAIRFKGKDIFSMDPKEFARQVAFVSQEFGSGFSFTVMEMALMGRIPHLKRLQFETKKDIEAATRSLSATGILDLRDKLFDELSAGDRQRVMIARALAQEPTLLFLDEPTSHLDIGHQIQILDLLKRLNSVGELTVCCVLHDLNLASAYCNRIFLFDKGSVFRAGTPAEVLTYQNIEAVYRTVVLVNKNPLTGNPNVILVPRA